MAPDQTHYIEPTNRKRLIAPVVYQSNQFDLFLLLGSIAYQRESRA